MCHLFTDKPLTHTGLIPKVKEPTEILFFIIRKFSMKLSQGSCVFSVQNGIVGGGCKRNGGISKQRNSLVLLQAFMGGKKDDVQISGSGNVDEGKCLRAV